MRENSSHPKYSARPGAVYNIKIQSVINYLCFLQENQSIQINKCYSEGEREKSELLSKVR